MESLILSFEAVAPIFILMLLGYFLKRIKLAEKVRNLGFSCEMDLTNKKFVKQLEKASKTAKYALILGEDEINSNTITIKNLETSEQKNISLENIAAELD